ncbi:MAG: anion permease, partial [Deltaproteobacteria bacterium]|nr:anion permease [Deltaproteobacteria bacterium]
RVPLAVGMLKEATVRTISFTDYTVAVIPLVVIMLVFGFFVIKSVFPVDIESVEKAHDALHKRIRAMGKTGYGEYAVGIILLLTFAAWVAFGRTMGLATIALTSVVFLFVLRLVRWKDIEEEVNWGIILMYGGAIIMGTALERSGAAQWLAQKTIGHWVVNPWTAVALFSLVSLLLTEGMSNAAVIAIMLPVAIGFSHRFSMDPSVMTYAIAIPAGLAFCLPMATPANAIAVSSSYISVKDMAKAGTVMAAVSWAAFILVAWLYWPLIGIKY